MLTIKNLRKRYGNFQALDGLNLEVADGELFGFVGPNGAGKTTTLKAAVGILQFDAGDIFIGGRSIRTDPLGCKRQLAYIPDNPDLYDYMTGIGYLRFVADVFGVGTNDRAGRIRRYSESFGLAADLNSPEHTGLDEGFEKTAAFRWLCEHAGDYGFILRYPKDAEDKTEIIYEPWHWRYVGVENAAKINASGLCFEDYIETLQSIAAKG